MENKPKRKATRRIKKFDFSDENATVSLVSEDVGGPANGFTTLLIKSNKKVSEEFLRKASEITVTMEITEYLRRFYNVWYEDAEILARSLGFVTAEMERSKEGADYSYEDMIQEKVASIKVMKQLHEADNIEDALLSISEEDYIQFLQDQEVVEKALLQLDSESVKAEEEASTKNVDVEKSGEGKTSVVKQKKKGKENMTEEVQNKEQVEVIAKSEFESIQKAFDEQKLELQKALDLVNELKKEKQEAIAKARKSKLEGVVGDKAEVILKAFGEVEDGVFDSVLAVFTDMKEQIEKSKMFEEVGAATEEESVKEDPVARLIKQKYNK